MAATGGAAVTPSLVRRLPEPVYRALGALCPSPWPYAIVAFHRIADWGDELSYPPTAFDALCRYWRDHYELLTLDCLLARLAQGDVSDHPCLTVTFDDGYADNAEVAAGILDRYGIPATFFVTTGAIGTTQCFPWDAGLSETPRMMSWNQVRGLHAAGFRIGSHTVHHVRMSATAPAVLEAELSASRQRLEAELGEAVYDFAYPFGGITDCGLEGRTAVQRAGYRCCCSCHGGLVAATDSPFHLNRVSVSPRYHPTPQAWARAYARLRWQASSAAAHW